MVENTKKQRNKISIKKMINAITSEIKNREITKLLLQNKVYETNDFMWQSIPRNLYNIDSDISKLDNVTINFMYHELVYGYEYSGLTERLIYQPYYSQLYLTLCYNFIS